MFVACQQAGPGPQPPRPPAPETYDQVTPLDVPIGETVTEKDPPSNPGLPDYHDSPYGPPASHLSQYWEWLGPGVTEEGAPRDADTRDDGISVLNPGNFRPGGKLDFVVTVCSRYPEHPEAFRPTERAGLGVWVDWNHNKTFEPGENVFHKFLDVRFVLNGNPVHCGQVSFPVIVPANFQPKIVVETNQDGSTREGLELPAVRGRLNYNTVADIEDARPPGYSLPNVAGETNWGEVEDVEIIGG